VALEAVYLINHDDLVDRGDIPETLGYEVSEVLVVYF